MLKEMFVKEVDTNLDSEGKILVGDELGFASNEAYKRLRTNLSFSFSGSDQSRVIGITSSLSGEGKSTTSVNLAHSLALVDKKVVLIECDLRKPTISKKLGIAVKKGLSNLLVGDIQNLSTIIQKDINGKKFDLITSGDIPPNPSELLGSSEMRKVVELLKPIYNYIIIDLPPVSLVSDPLVVSKITDGMILVVRHDYTEKALVKDSIKQFEHVGAKILGYVYNGVDYMNNKKYKYGKYKKYKQGYSYYESSEK